MPPRQAFAFMREAPEEIYVGFALKVQGEAAAREPVEVSCRASYRRRFSRAKDFVFAGFICFQRVRILPRGALMMLMRGKRAEGAAPLGCCRCRRRRQAPAEIEA